MTAYWLQKERWLHSTNATPNVYPLSEIWDGKKFAELSWFWNPEKQWLLPVHCGSCNQVISTKEITSAMQGLTVPTSELSIICPHCFSAFNVSLRYANGNPHNLAVIGHWDGWQPFSSSNKHSCGKSFLCMYSRFV